MPSYDPELYALLHRGTPGDEAFYVEHCRGQRVLELGAGYGRLMPALADVASEYVGLERDPGMLRLATAALDNGDAAELLTRLRAHFES